MTHDLEPLASPARTGALSAQAGALSAATGALSAPPAAFASAASSGAELRVGWRRSATAAAITGLGSPALWSAALAAFLLRGGLFLFAAPVVVIPSTVGVATFIGPLAITAAGPTTGFIELGIAVALVAAVWYVGGGLVAAWAETYLIRRTALTGGEPARANANPFGRLLLVRLIAAIPLLVTLAWASSRVADVAYRELVLPGDVSVPLPVRVLGSVVDGVAVVVAVWLLSEAVAGVAARRVVLHDERALPALGRAVLQLVQHPLPAFATAIVPLAGAALLVGPALAASAISWNRLGDALQGGVGPLAIALTFVFVAIWCLGLVLAGAAAAWRSVAWTFEDLRIVDAALEPSQTSLDAGLLPSGAD